MITKAEQSSRNSRLQLIILGVGISLIVPLFPIPGPAFSTGQPWKVELIWAIVVLALSMWCFRHAASLCARRLSTLQPDMLILLPLLLFTIWSGMSVLWADVVSSVVHHTGVWFLYTAIYLAALIFFLKTKSVKALYQVIAFVSVTVLILAAFDYITLPDFKLLEGGLRIRYSKHGEMLAMAAPFLCSAAFYARNRIARFAALAISSAAWLTVMLSLSKGAFLAGVAGYAILFVGIFLFSGRKLRKTAISVAVLWVVFTISVQFSVAHFAEFPSTSQYISGKADHNRSSSHFRTFVWRIGTQMAASHAIKGVGADNFGTSFNRTREEYSAGQPIANRDEDAEDFMPERAHNEAIQILAELGVVGLILLAAAGLMFVVPLIRIVANRRRVSPFLIGCVSGMSAFILSSMVSSFSFRAMQNGVMFFLLVAAGMYEINKSNKIKRRDDDKSKGLISNLRWSTAVWAAVLVIFFSAVGASNFYTMFAFGEKDPIRSVEYFQTALALNRENGAAYFMAGSRAYLENRPRDAVRDLHRSLNYGATATITYYYLAKSFEQAGKLEWAAASSAEAVRIYPQSTYARVHYSILLSKLGREKEAASQFAAAELINSRQAKTWKLVLEKGLLIATDKTRNNKSLDMPYQIRPANLIEAIHNEEQLRIKQR